MENTKRGVRGGERNVSKPKSSKKTVGKQTGITTRVAWGTRRHRVQADNSTNDQAKNVSAMEQRRKERQEAREMYGVDEKLVADAVEQRLEGQFFEALEDYKMSTLGAESLKMLWQTCETLERRLQEIHIARIEAQERATQNTLVGTREVKRNNYFSRRYKSIVGHIDSRLGSAEKSLKHQSLYAKRASGEDQLCSICCYCQ